MSNALALPVNDAAAIGELFERSKSALVDAVLARLECGKRLQQKKQELGHGEWLSWLNSNADVLGFGPWTAQRLIAAHKANPGLTTHLSDGEALALSRKMWANDRKPRAELPAPIVPPDTITPPPVTVEPVRELVDGDHDGDDDEGGHCGWQGCTATYDGHWPPPGWLVTASPCGAIVHSAHCPEHVEPVQAARAVLEKLQKARRAHARIVAKLHPDLIEGEVEAFREEIDWLRERND